MINQLHFGWKTLIFVRPTGTLCEKGWPGNILLRLPRLPHEEQKCQVMLEGLQKMHGCLEMSEETEGLRTGEEKSMMSNVTCLGFCLLRVDKTR